MSFPENANPSDETVNLPLAQRRGASFGSFFINPGGNMVATLNASAGTLTFAANGTPRFLNGPLALQLVYAAGGPYNIAGCASFILGFSRLSGVGSLYVEVGSSDGITGEYRVDLTGPGDVNYSVGNVKPNSIHSVESFNILRFVFEARSTEFSFTLDEIRLVPEPSGAVLALTAGAGLLALRRRRMAGSG